MRKIMYNQALFILQKTRNTHIFTTSQKNKCLIYPKRKIISWFKNAELLHGGNTKSLPVLSTEPVLCKACRPWITVLDRAVRMSAEERLH